MIHTPDAISGFASDGSGMDVFIIHVSPPLTGFASQEPGKDGVPDSDHTEGGARSDTASRITTRLRRHCFRMRTGVSALLWVMRLRLGGFEAGLILIGGAHGSKAVLFVEALPAQVILLFIGRWRLVEWCHALGVTDPRRQHELRSAVVVPL